MNKKILLIFTTLQCISGQIVFPDSQYVRRNYLQQVAESERYTSDSDNLNNLNSNSLLDGNNGDNTIGRSINNFAININKVLLNKFEESHEENVILSPLSIVGALSLLTLGSVGKTYDELTKVLGFFDDVSRSRTAHDDFAAILNKLSKKDRYYQRDRDTSQNITYGSSIFLHNSYPIRRQYEDVVKNVYKSEINKVDFEKNAVEAQRIINKWVSDLTHGKIQNILTTVPPYDTRLIITTALYFRAEWEKYFLDGITKKSPFTLDKRFPNETIEVDMMANEGNFSFYKSLEHECLILGLPYKGNKTTLYALKPLESSNKSLRQLLNEMTPEIFEFLISKARKQSTIVLFPKMKLTSGYNLKSTLQKMGVKSVFSKSEANLALVSPNKMPFIPSYTSQDNDRLIFTRFGTDEAGDEGCTEFFDKNNTELKNCTTTEVIQGKKVKVVYKKIGDKIGRKIERRSIGEKRMKRQTYDLWNPGLYVDDVVHKVDIDITETGTEAAAATMVFISRDGRRPVFRANEPFFFVIRDEESTLPLFTSVIYKPIPNYE